MTVRIPAIVLAAGLSTRMGAFKPLLMLRPREQEEVAREGVMGQGEGKPLIAHVIDALEASGAIETILVVTGYQHEKLEAALQQKRENGGLITLYNERYAEGEMLSSLQRGIAALPENAPAFLLALADQPAVRPATIAQLVRAAVAGRRSGDFVQWPTPPLVLPTTLGKRGHPVVISTSLVPEIRNLAPGESLRTVVHRHLVHATLLNVDDPSIHEDLDTPADFARAQAALSVKDSSSPA